MTHVFSCKSEKRQTLLKQQFSGFVLLITVMFPLIATAQTQLASAPDPQAGTIIGTVVDANGGVVPQAAVSLSGPGDQRSVFANGNGFFQFQNVKPGIEYHVSISMQDFAQWNSSPITLSPGQYFMLSGIQLRVATVQISVVALTPDQIATEEVHKEEKQRVLGLIPDFYVNYDQNPAPMTVKLKFQLALKALNDPVTLAGYLLNAGIYQAGDYPSYRGGMAGYGQRLGSTVAGGYTHLLIGDAVLPSLLHQDPRFFYQANGSGRSRALYALSNVIFVRGDKGQREINYSGIGGDLVSGAVANAYYPHSERGGGLVWQGALIGTGGRLAYALAEEFILNTPGFHHHTN